MIDLNNKDNNINENNYSQIDDEEDEINSTNNLIEELTFGCSTNSFKRPKINIINQETNEEAQQKNESEIFEISEDLKDFNDIKKMMKKTEKKYYSDVNNNNKDNNIISISESNNSKDSQVKVINNSKNTKDKNNIFNNENKDINLNININTDSNNNINIQNYDTLNTINSIASTIRENNNNALNNNINQSLKNLLINNRNEIISIKETKYDITLTSMDSSTIKIDKQSINQSLINLVYGNKDKIRNDLSSYNSNLSNNNIKNDIKSSEEINQSLINLINVKNETNSKKSNGMHKKKENVNLDNMFKDLKYKLKMEKIGKKILYTGFVDMYDDNSEKKKIKHVNIINKDKNNNLSDDEHKLEKLYVYENNGIINNNEKIKSELTLKNRIDEDKYYYINQNKDINKKIHYSKLFQNNKKI